jgi:hypothetical protein
LRALALRAFYEGHVAGVEGAHRRDDADDFIFGAREAG